MMAWLLICCLAPAAAGQTEPERLIEEGHWKRARGIVEPWIRAKPDEPLANFLLSQIRAAFHDRESPLPLAEKAVQLDGHTAKYHRQLAECLGVTAQYSGMLRQLFLARRFKKEIDTALTQDPTDLQALRDAMEFYLLAPGIAGGDKEQARAAAHRIERIDMAAGYLAEAGLAEFQKEAGKIEESVRKAVESEPGNYRARIALANHYLSLHEYDLAEIQARAGVKIAGGRVDAYAVLATADAARGNRQELRALLADSERAVPDDLTPYYRAAETLAAAHRDTGEAERLLRKYLDAEAEGNAPTAADARRLLAQLHH